MQNIFLAWPTDRTVTISSDVAAVSDMPATNMLTSHPGDVARFVTTSLVLVFTMDKPMPIDGIALIATNLSPLAQITFQGTNDSAASATSLFGFEDTLTQDPYLEGIGGINMPVMAFDFTKESYQAYLDSQTNKTRVSKFSSAQTYRYWRVAISDPLNPDGYIQIGRSYLFNSYQPSINASLGFRQGTVDPSQFTITRGGNQRPDIYGQRKFVEFVLSGVTETEWRTKVNALEAARGLAKDVLFIKDYDQTTYRDQDTIYGLMKDGTGIAFDKVELYSKPYRIEELLP